MADGYVFDHWEPVSPISGRLDAFEWKAPVERMPSGQPAPLPLPDHAEPSRPQATAIAVVPQPQSAMVALPSVLDRITAVTNSANPAPPSPALAERRIHDIEPEEPEPSEPMIETASHDDGSKASPSEPIAEAPGTPPDTPAGENNEPPRPAPWGRGRRFRLFG
jgi:HemY protein